MKTATKIRWLLLIVTIGLFATSLTARWAATKLVNLNDVAAHIQSYLSDKENTVYDYVNDTTSFKDLKKLTTHAALATQTIKYFTSKNIFFQTFRNNKLEFWSDAIINASNLQVLKEGTSFLSYSNGWYEVIKKKQNNFFVVFFIPVKANYPYQNQYLKNGFNQDLIIDNSVEIADLSDVQIADIKNTDGRYLFSIKKTDSTLNVPYSKMEVIMWALGFLTLVLLFNSICKYYADLGYPGLATIALFIGFAFIRYLGLKYHFPNALYSIELFNPGIFASNFIFPSFADLCLNLLVILWSLVFLHSYKSKIFKPINNPWIGYPILLYGTILLIYSSFLFSDVFFGLIFNSNINFKVSNIISLNWLSFLGIIILMVGLLSYYIIIDILVTFSSFINISIRNKIILLFCIFLAYNCYELFFNQYNIFFILIFALVIISGRLIYYYNGKIVFPALLLISLIFATLVSIKLNRFENFKDIEVRKRLVLKLEAAEDPYALISFEEIEKEIPKNIEVKKLANESSIDGKILNKVFNDNYLLGYLNKFNYKSYLFDKNDALLNRNETGNIESYRQKVIEGSIKVTQNFYRLNKTLGFQNYFAIIPIKTDSTNLGTLVLDLKTKDLERFGSFPQLLQNGKIDQHTDFNDYSYAFYENKKLVNQYGSFVYERANKDFKGTVKDFVILKKKGFDHIIYKPDLQSTIVVTQPSNTFWRELASLSFFFIIFLIGCILIVSYEFVWKFINTYELTYKNLKVKLMVANNKLLYKTRIQIALVLAVVSSLLIIGIITFSYISIQYKDQQKDLLKGKMKIIAQAFEENISQELKNIGNPNQSLSFEEFSKMYDTDLNLFDTRGKLLFSTQYKIYAAGLVAERMDADAFVNLNIQQKSEYIHDENIDKLSFTSAYMPIKNNQNDVIAYLQLPYFANQNDYDQKIGTFLNLLINIYVLVFVAIAFFAFVVANQITSPLSLIQESFSKTMMGRKNEPIEWKRNDEIGSLITEYNNMVKTLEENANKLAQSERETAWREMAKQVAHEIKNPLTPLRLGIQMLDRSWKDKDANFDSKFQKFSKSFLEQIDSLSHIASEFSNFAKMPELKLEKVNLLDILNKAIQVYEQMDHIKIICDEKSLQKCTINVDKDQLLRSFNNLLKNAIEAIPDGREGIINIVGKQKERKVELQIKDNGNGIPLNSQERIFVPNFTTKSSGTGLGLAFVKQAIENVGGNIYFNTEINVGTTFHIILPLVN
ncbi:MAG: ATP-binding protein [Pelobium sp.]